ncbi:MAG: RHS repeat-associated core domain-containing protein [Chloroflexi bacterium]|nr:MAG: RHS repeat-associated core domain-containing protein [Chloroflexota bacterium]MBL1192959.1 RHS repeat-associated core domain-containing protein [Chloroflexota bacterium]NOH10251.1 RHS repeat-associated core domain-containing protein [Chloroflexota bacterium]
MFSDGETSYLYGRGRIGEYNSDEEQWLYHHADAMGSVRQLGDASQEIIFSQSYDPYGMSTVTAGSESNYGYTGQWTDANDLVHLRARYYAPGMGRFMNRDTWMGNYYRPLSLNQWNYVEGNPVSFTDPSGHCPPKTDEFSDIDVCWIVLNRIEQTYTTVDLQWGFKNRLLPPSFEGKRWTVSELNTIEAALQKIDVAMSSGLGGLKGSFGKRTLRFVRYSDSFLYPGGICGLFVGNQIHVYDNFSSICGERTIVHEIAHYLDWNSRFTLSKKFRDYVGASIKMVNTPLPTCPPEARGYCSINTWEYCEGSEIPPYYSSAGVPNEKEDFAASVAEYLYEDGRNIVPGQKRWEFIETLFTTGLPPTQ